MARVSITVPFFRFLVLPARRFAALLALGHALCLGAQQPLDLLIAGGRVVDGSGSPAQLADVGIRDGKIAAIGSLDDASAIRTIDADGLAVAPGFIDIHNHSDDTLLEEPRCESMIRQGVTTVILGEGRSMGPLRSGERPWTTLGGYFDFVARKGAAVNVASYVGHEQVWTYVKGHAMTAPTAAEIESMKTTMTSMNAEKVNIQDRGLLKAGYWADVVIFDPRTVIDRATFEAPQQYPVGIPYVVVNGEVVLDGEKHTGALPGKVIRGPGYRVRRP